MRAIPQLVSALLNLSNKEKLSLKQLVACGQVHASVTRCIIPENIMFTFGWRQCRNKHAIHKRVRVQFQNLSQSKN